MYMSLHRYDHGFFFPNSEDADFDQVGKGAGEGYNVNIAWNKVSRLVAVINIIIRPRKKCFL